MCGCKKPKTAEQAQALQVQAEQERQESNQKLVNRWADQQKRIDARRAKLKGAT